MEIQMPEKVEYIINELIDNGYEAYAVGGCVRDSLLGRIPEDWDIATSAQPEEVKKLFRRTIDTGIKHGTVTVMMDKEGFEVTTYRIDGEYEDARHPKEVSFTSSLLEDLKRRDFTMNAMAYNTTQGVIDLFGGINDMENKVIRAVGNPEERFTEDALRILRAIRFSAQLGFNIHKETKQGICNKAPRLALVSAERIQAELSKLLLSKEPGRIREAYYEGVIAVVLPELNHIMEVPQNNPHHCYTVGEHSIRAMELVEPWSNPTVEHYKKDRLILKWTMLLHDIAKPQMKTSDEDGIDHFYGHQEEGYRIAGEILRRLKFDNETVETVRRLVRWHDYRFGEDRSRMRRAINKIGEDIMELLFAVKRADIAAQNPEMAEDKYNMLEDARRRWHYIIENRQCVTLKQLEICGFDLINMGFPQGKAIGDMLDYLLQQVLQEPEMNQREQLIKLAEAYRSVL